MKRVLVVGDIMFDKYVFVESTRMSPEGPIPVNDEVRIEVRPGGAANVAKNVKSLGGDEVHVELAGILDFGRKMNESIFESKIDYQVFCQHGPSMIKQRFVDQKTLDRESIIFRHDNFKKFPAEFVERFEERLEHFLKFNQYDAIIISDYDKGTVTEKVMKILQMRTTRSFLIVDSKRQDLSIYEGTHVMKLNADEYSRQFPNGMYEKVESLSDYVVVTQGSYGATLKWRSQTSTGLHRGRNGSHVVTAVEGPSRYIINHEHFKAIEVKAKDVTGCGDTHTAAMTWSLISDESEAGLCLEGMRRAVSFANRCAADVVSQFGTSAVRTDKI